MCVALRCVCVERMCGCVAEVRERAGRGVCGENSLVKGEETNICSIRARTRPALPPSPSTLHRLGFSAQPLQFQVQDSELRVQGSALPLHASGCTVHAVGARSTVCLAVGVRGVRCSAL